MTAYKQGDPTTLNRLYGRSSTHKLRKGQQELVDNLLPQIGLPEEGPLTAQALFGDDRPMHFEIGFGGGEHLAYRADLLPAHGFIGCEPFVNGVAQALVHVKEQALTNVRLYMGDALEQLRRVPDGSLSFVYLLHPDPWPKARHAKRRMMNDGPVDMIAAKLKPGGEFRCATDHPVYLSWALMVMQLEKHREQFDWMIEDASGFLEKSGGWVDTRYAAKARREGRRPYYLRYRRR
ncbi:tRNA (guanine(46)-N(7))-methyltransferase TrmB [Sphingomicrobium aestuariivivum]|uniref:tRNA (guanine(46)-N(7))-methyltransferase TrmB n=1 Tax=Sphingomicrobium aestuariivivum TaxID=1582356 RepID=UPI001FD637FC|nr:tRNA (guanine(46)-N(7))-methyltransferase TrmB [Sphingomicrobium aestuariivivum]MCJ8191681.1 tRNA (guanine(46)-N(7))-methyltransferase TrmB [Sphingomicrobium aestuariivivum]